MYLPAVGDSYTQTGFNPNSTLPNDANPFGNPPFPGWTATGGVNWLGFAIASYNKSQILTYNYAYGGATIDANLVKPYQPTVLSLTDQVNQFLNGAAKKPDTTPWTSENAIFSIYIGINDIGNSWWLDGDRGAFSDVLLNAEFALVEKLYSAGARNFLFVNVPPINRSPLMLAQPPASQAAEKVVIEDFNRRLAAKVHDFASTHRGVRYWVYDTYAHFTKILNAPKDYGFKDATSYGNAPDIFWGNDYHPSTYAHEYFGEAVSSLLSDTEW